MPMDVWAGSDSAVTRHVLEESRRTLDAYEVKPGLVKEHAAIERATRQGGYGHRQIFELVQNGADALIGHVGGRIKVLVAKDALYCANEGSPVTPEGAEAILSSHVSMKRGGEIGRFGIGFKSVLAVSSTPEFFSRSGSFGFDGDWAAEKIRAVVPDAERLPVLRLARDLDAALSARQDPRLAELMEWATTVVRLRHDPGAADWLGEDLRLFPPQFLLFSPHVASLELEDALKGKSRQIRMQETAGTYTLSDGESDAKWKLVHTTVAPEADARADAGFDDDRDTLPVHWAIPLGGRAQRGRFWAFFPTEYVTTLTGIVNAPWKTNEDRQNLLRGPLNEQLIDAAARLVVDTLPDLRADDDPGRVLDTLPAREAFGWADQAMNDHIYELARESPSVPDQDGNLSVPSTLELHPAGLSRETLSIWAAYPGRPRAWCHPSVETRERRLRAERLVGGRGEATVSRWLEALAADGTPGASKAAIQAAAGAVRDLPAAQYPEIRRAHVVLGSDGRLVELNPERVYLEGEQVTGEVVLVHPDVALDASTRAALDELGFETVDAEGALRSYVAGLAWEKPTNWEAFWTLADRVDPEIVVQLARLRERPNRPILVLTCADRFSPVDECILPGPVVPAGGGEDRGITVDTGFHSGTQQALELLGVRRGPEPGQGRDDAQWLSGYARAALAAYADASVGDGGESVAPDELVMNRRPFPGPVELLERLSDEGRIRFTKAYVELPQPDDWVLSHRRSPEDHLRLPYMSPGTWYAREHGRVRSSQGIVTPSGAVGPSFEQWADMLPVATVSHDVARCLRMPSAGSDVSESVWQEAFSNAADWGSDEEAGRFYGFAALHTGPPPKLRSSTERGTELVPIAEVTVATNLEDVKSLTEDGLAVLYVPPGSGESALAERWGLRSASDIRSVDVNAIRVRDDIPLVDEFPALQFRLDGDELGLMLARCSELLVETVTPRGKRIDERDLQVHDGIVYWKDALGDAALIERLNKELALGLDAEEVDKLAVKRARRERNELVRRIRSQKTDAERLLEAVGAELILRQLPSHLVEAVEDANGELSAPQAARLALVVYGSEVLKVFREELASRGLQPPHVWNGSRSARAFVRELGFPPGYAGLERTRRDPWFEVAGPPDLPPLHDFQKAIANRAMALIESSRPRRRGIISLPTGAGKTRVLVEALVRAMAQKRVAGPILWIAQTDELCEQAVETWGYVWRGFGPPTSLRISRLWSSNEAELLEGGDQVVVATGAKLGVCAGSEQYEWLTRASCVVVDEAHGSTTPSYTELFRWLGLGRAREADGCPLIGLTATPFRGTSEEETKRLVGRYDRNRLDEGLLGDDPYRHLQDMSVLARVRHKLLPGSEINLTAEELARLQQTRLLPPSAGASLAADMDRNRVLIESVSSLPSDWTVLLYAASVDHAELLAALLSLEGIPSAAVSSRTAQGARREFVNQFRAGGLRVLTNFSVFTEGFDAPAVRAVYVARPTFSPNLYQQMIGRGLRGPLNGGKEECLVVNVADNVAQYGEELAFREFEYLWSRGAESVE